MIAGDEIIGAEWTSVLQPSLEQCGYQPRLLQPAILQKLDGELLEGIAASKLLIVDVTEAGPEVYYAAGYAARADIPIIWTAKNDGQSRTQAPKEWIRPIPWESPETLAELLRQRL